MSVQQPRPETKGSSPEQLGGTSSDEAQVALRLEKARTLAQRGMAPFGNGLVVTHTTADVSKTHGGQDAATLDALDPMPTYTVAGRVTELRRMGKIAFVRVFDREGTVQVLVRRDACSGGFGLIDDSLLDRGDIVRVVGRPLRTRTGELSIEATDLVIVTKSLRPMPEKWHGIADVELRYRRRYVDLFTTEGVRDTFVKRARCISSIRRVLDARGYIEVETPILHDMAGGAAARPFRTHHNALDLNLQLRIATELHLKRLVVGGMERVYEIGRIFRNEGIDRRHNPEFTSIEFYEAHATCADLMGLTENLLETVARDVTGGVHIPYQGTTLDFSAPYPQVSMVGAVGKLLSRMWALAVSATDDASAWLDALVPHAEALRGACLRLKTADDVDGVLADREGCERMAAAHVGQGPATLGHSVSELFEFACEPMLDPTRPTFVVDFPLEVSPLARRRDGDARLVDRFELYVAGMELANAFSELNDPVDQRERFAAQVEAASRGDAEAMPYDHDFIRALEHGMPPTAGEGIGIDRLVMVLTDSPSIRDVVLFPLLRPEAPPADSASVA